MRTQACYRSRTRDIYTVDLDNGIFRNVAPLVIDDRLIDGIDEIIKLLPVLIDKVAVFVIDIKGKLEYMVLAVLGLGEGLCVMARLQKNVILVQLQSCFKGLGVFRIEAYDLRNLIAHLLVDGELQRIGLFVPPVIIGAYPL